MSILCIGTDTTIEMKTSFERFIGMPYMRLDHDFTENRFTVTIQTVPCHCSEGKKLG